MPKTVVPSVDSILNTVIDAILVIDDRGIIQVVNPAVEKIFGYKPQELIGRTINTLMPQPYAREHDGYIRDYLRTGKTKVIGVGREVVAKKKDGTIFPVYLGVSEGRRERGKRFFTGVIRDMTEAKRSRDELKKQNEFTAAVLNTVRSLVIVLDRAGRIVNFNRACEDTTGYSFKEVSGRSFLDFFVAAEDREAAVRNFLVSDPKRAVNNFEAVWLTKKGDKRLIAWSNSLLSGEKKSPEFVIGTGIDITERRDLERMVLEVTKNEQRRIGQELHDGIAQNLTTTAIVAKLLEKKLSKRSLPEAREVKRVVGMINQAIAQTRELAQGLYAMEIKSEDLISSLKNLARETEKTIGIRCVFHASGDAPEVRGTCATHLYRITREALNNAVKHGHGKNIEIQLSRKSGHEGVLRVENDGRRLPKTLSERKGLGMRLMNSRAAVMNASLSIAPKPKGGAVVTCIFPIPL